MYKIESGKRIKESNYKEILLDILKEVADFCEKNNINYLISSGTLLGAIRHNGFIPWDDDIDIQMMKSDYDRFLKEFKSDKYKVLCSSNTDDYYYGFAKVVDTRTKVIERSVKQIKDMGLWIDIFPYDYFSNNDLVNRFKIFKLNRYYKYLFYYRIKKETLIERGIYNLKNKIMLKIFNNNLKLCKKNINKILNMGCKKKTNKVGHLNLTHSLKNIYPNYFDEYIYHDFENCKFRIVKEYDKFLTQKYGNYMKMLPKEQQVSNHDFDAYWR